MDLKLLFSTSFLFLMILDPVGNIPIFVSYLKGYSLKRQRQIVMRELFFVLLILLIFFFFGQPFFALLDIEQSSLQIAGSINFFLIGIKMLFSKRDKELPKRKEEPFLVPLATPAVAGPGIISTVMVYGGNQEISNLLVFCAIFISWLFLVPILLGATFLKDLLKENGIIATERLFAYLVILIAAQMAVSGLKATFLL